MATFEKYNLEQAQDEAEELRDRVERGEAKTYAEADQQLELSKLEPKEDEKALWSILEETDKPIQTILKRFNRIVSEKFPKYKLRTSSSCSGHIDESGHLEAVLHRSGIEPELQNPHLMFYTRSKTHQKEMATYLRKIFEAAIDKVERELESEVIGIEEDLSYFVHTSYIEGLYGTVLTEELAKKYPSRKTYSLYYTFPVLDRSNAFPVLKCFWKAVEESLTDIDEIHIKSQFQQEDFKHTKGD